MTRFNLTPTLSLERRGSAGAAQTAVAVAIILISGFFAAATSAQVPATAGPDSVALAPMASAAPLSAGHTAATLQDWNFHLQNTDIVQGDPGFPAKYSGPNSLSSKGEIQHTDTTDLFAGKRLWRGAEAHADFLMWQGFGLSQTLGVEAFPNGDAYKLGTVNPNFTFARLFIRQTIDLGGEKEDIPDDQLTLAGKEDVKRLTFTLGRFSATDIFDNNTYASDPHTQFMNWATLANITWDYAADSVGYTTGFTAELNQPRWALRYGAFLLPSQPNSFTGDDQLLMWPHRGAFGPITREWAMNTEFERRYTIHAHPGSCRLQAWVNEADMARYASATALLLANPSDPEGDLVAARSFRYKYGVGLNWEQEVANNVGMFSRLGWNDGQEEPWAYTDANWTASLGVSVDGAAWNRAGDTFGLVGVVSGASSANQKFLEAGGLGILDGDGALNYGPEESLETYYNRQVAKNVHATLDYQFVANPAFNRDRGPVSIFGVRLHWAF